jgi:hypothetical protein
MRWSLKWMLVTGVAVMAAGPARAASPELPAVQSRDFAAMAAKLSVGVRLRLENLQIADSGETRTLVMERFAVFAPDARITIHGDSGDKEMSPPANIYFQGEVEGQPGSRAFLARLADGRTQGMVTEGGEIYLIGADLETKAAGGPIEMQRVDPVLLKSSRGSDFHCGNEKLPPGRGSVPVETPFLSPVQTLPEKATLRSSYKVRLAIESDFEFFQKFNDVSAAVNYVGNLIGFSSSIYQGEIGAGILVQSISLWTTASDPWNQQDTNCGLLEFGHYWNLNRTNAPRTIAHFMSGRTLGGGVAWVGVLGSGPFNAGGTCPGLATDAPWGGGYGFTANLAGDFNINSPTVVWDIVAVSHEIGHNFNSPHSHCYGGIGGSASPIDQCDGSEVGPGCYAGTAVLPGPPGVGSGTIMSYCHSLSPGLSNISLTFGLKASYGVLPGREAAQMSSYVVSVATNNPGVLPFVFFNDDFESGAIHGSWSGQAP